MGTVTRPPNKTIWALDEALKEHDPAIEAGLREVVRGLRREMDDAGRRADKGQQARLGEMAMTVAEMRAAFGRLHELHRLARQNDYDRR